LPAGNESRFVIPNFKAAYDAGLRPEGKLEFVSLSAYDAGQTAYARLRISGFENGDAGGTAQNVAAGAEVSTTSQGHVFKNSSWMPLEILAAPIGSTAYGVMDFRVTGGTGFVAPGGATAWVRWTPSVQ
jgi:hypothetical protein